MGNLFSSGKNKKISSEEELQRLQQHHGVLIPPIFTVSQDDGYAVSSVKNNMPISTQAQWHAVSSPNLVEKLWTLTAGYNLLTEYMSPGIYFAVPTNKMGRIHMALNIANKNTRMPGDPPNTTSGSTHEAIPSSNSFVSLTQALLLLPPTILVQPLHVQCLLPASSQQLSPYIEVSSKNGSILPYITLSTRFNPLQPNDKNGNINALWKLPLSKNNNIQMMLGAWMTNDSIQYLLAQEPKHYYNHSNNCKQGYDDEAISWNQQLPPHVSPSTRNYSPSTVHLQGVMEYQESIMALHAEIPLSVNSGYVPERFDTLLWINLSDNSAKDHNDNIPSSSCSSTSSPPLWLTLKQSTTRGHASPHYTLNLSQILSFDRKCWNILEERAPFIRNHIGWTFQIQQQQQQQQLYQPEQENHSSATSWSFATNWQINRHVAIKAVLDHSGNYLRTNVIFKTWQQPRMTLSILHGIDLTNGGTWKWLGCGWELETTATTTATTTTTTATMDRTKRNNEGNCSSTDSTLMSAGYHETANLEGIKAPPTKIQIPLPPPPPSSSSSRTR